MSYGIYAEHATAADKHLWQGITLDDYSVGTRIVSHKSKMFGTIISVRDTKHFQQFTVQWDYCPKGATRTYNLAHPEQFSSLGLPYITNKRRGEQVKTGVTFVSPASDGRAEVQAAIQVAHVSGDSVLDIDSLMLALDASGWTFTPKEV